jgi:NADPH-dependent 2,4-dienoyl-CoA reductase/sulfur reductase-like enzyme
MSNVDEALWGHGSTQSFLESLPTLSDRAHLRNQETAHLNCTSVIMPPKVCVLGSGILGLASATLLAEAGYTVTVVARDMPGDPGGLSWASPR